MAPNKRAPAPATASHYQYVLQIFVHYGILHQLLLLMQGPLFEIQATPTIYKIISLKLLLYIYIIYVIIHKLDMS